MNYYEIGQRIRKFRKAQGLSQEQLAEKVEISVTHMSHIETGNTKLSLPVLVSIAKALEVLADDLISDSYSDKSRVSSEILEILDSCNEKELKILLDILRASKTSLEKYK